MRGFLLFFSVFQSSKALADFETLKSGFRNLTQSYLVPLSAAVAGCAFVTYIILAYFEMEKYQRKIGNVALLALFGACGVALIDQLIQIFGGVTH